MQRYGSGMITPDLDPDPIHIIEAYLEIKKTPYTVISQKEESTSYSICHFLFYTMYSTISPESSGLKIINKILIYLLFHSCWIRIRNK